MADDIIYNNINVIRRTRSPTFALSVWGMFKEKKSLKTLHPTKLRIDYFKVIISGL